MKSCKPLLVSVKPALEDYAVDACVTLNLMQSLAEGALGSKWMTGIVRLDPANVLKAKVLFG